MTVSVVVMIIIGFVLIFASFFIFEKKNKKEDNFNVDLLTVDEDYKFSERELAIIKRKIEDVIAKQAKDILYETNESLSNMANEKTLALGDYAVAVCEEIEKNHKEVMFLYSMLDDKQKEIMGTVNSVKQTKDEIKEFLSQKSSLSIQDSSEITANTSKVVKESAIERLSNMTKQNEIQAKDSVKQDTPEVKQNKVEEHSVKSSQNIQKQEDKSSFVSETKSSKEAEVSSLDDIDMDDVFSEIDNSDIHFDDDFEEEFKENENSNDIILELHKNGNSIIEIAKQLGLGVGEVKLVIDLYQGDKA